MMYGGGVPMPPPPAAAMRQASSLLAPLPAQQWQQQQQPFQNLAGSVGGALPPPVAIRPSTNTVPLLAPQAPTGVDINAMVQGLAAYDGSQRTPQHQAYLRTLAAKVLKPEEVAALLHALNSARPVADRAVTELSQLAFTGSEAALIQQMLVSGTYQHLKDSAVAAFYEFVFTVDDFVRDVMANGTYCIQHLLAVRMQNSVPGDNAIAVDANSNLLPQRLTEEAIANMQSRIPPPDFSLWEVRDLAHRFPDKRFDTNKNDRLAGLEGLLSTGAGSGMMYVTDPGAFSKAMEYGDRVAYKTMTPGSHIYPKTPYDRCVDEAVLCDYAMYNTWKALSQGLFRVHFSEERQLQAPDTTAAKRYLWITLSRLVTDPKAGNGTQPLAALPEGLEKTYKTKRENMDAELGSQVPISATPIPKGHWINAFVHPYVSTDLAGVALLQPKPLRWARYTDNYVRALFMAVHGATSVPETMAHPALQSAIQVLTPSGGAIAEWFSVRGAPLSAMFVTKASGTPSPATDDSVKVSSDETKLAESIRDQRAGRSWLTSVANKVSFGYVGGTSAAAGALPQTVKQPVVQCFPWPHMMDEELIVPLVQNMALKSILDADNAAVVTLNDLGKGGRAPLVQADGTTPAKLVDETATDPSGATVQTGKIIQGASAGYDSHAMDTEFVGEKGNRRTLAVEVPFRLMTERMGKITGHMIRHCSLIAENVRKTRFDKWLQQNYLFPLIRVFHEVVDAEETVAEELCMKQFQPWPVMRITDKDAPGGHRMVSVPLSQAGYLDPISGKFIMNPNVDTAQSRCVVPGTAPQPLPISPILANAVKTV